MSDSKEVVNWEERMAADAKEVAKLERPSVGIISLRAGQMTYQEKQVPNNELDVVVVASCHERTYYSEDFDPDSPQTPVCFSQSVGAECEFPHEKSIQKQNDTCGGCPQDEWGSANRGRGKACKEIRKLMVMPMDSLQDEDSVGRSELAIIRIPVTSVKLWGSYVNQLASMYSRPPWAVKTKIKVSPHPKNQFQVAETYLGNVPSELLGAVNKRIEGAQQILLTPYEPIEEREEDPEPAPKKPIKKKY